MFHTINFTESVRFKVGFLPQQPYRGKNSHKSAKTLQFGQNRRHISQWTQSTFSQNLPSSFGEKHLKYIQLLFLKEVQRILLGLSPLFDLPT